MVERCVRDAEVASSNLVASIPACWSSGQDDALSRRKPGFDSRTGHDLNRLSEIQIAGFLFPSSPGPGPILPPSGSLKIPDTKQDAAEDGKSPSSRRIPFKKFRFYPKLLFHLVLADQFVVLCGVQKLVKGVCHDLILLIAVNVLQIRISIDIFHITV